MLQRIILAVALVMAFVVPTLASAGTEVGEKDNGLSICDETYLKTWDKVAQEKAGPYDGLAGRNLVEDGVETKDGTRPPTEAECQEGLRVMNNMLNPEPVVEEVAATETAAAPVESSGVANSTVMCESGGDYSINTGNGYYGGYQFDSGTWDAYGDPAYAEAHLAPPAVQDAAAASVPYDAWPNC